MKRKKINRKQLIHTFVFALFCVFGLTVVYAALSTTLNISGSASVNSGTFGLEITKKDLNNSSVCDSDEVSCYDNFMLHGNAKLVSAPVISGTTIKDFNFSVEIPGDYVYGMFNVTNNGSIPMKYTGNSMGDNIVITALDGSAPDYDWLENLMMGAEVTYPWGDPVSVDTIICPGETWGILMGMVIDEDATTLPNGGLLISNIKIEHFFEQTNMNACVQ